MRQISESDWRALLRHLPKVARPALRSSDNVTSSAGRMLYRLHAKLVRKEQRNQIRKIKNNQENGKL